MDDPTERTGEAGSNDPRVGPQTNVEDSGGEFATRNVPGLAALESADFGEPHERARVFENLFEGPAEHQERRRYVLLDTLGRGGMGIVLEAFDRTLDRRVAFKMLHPTLAAEHTTRLLREAQALAKLSHPNVVQIYDSGRTPEGRPFIAMELIRGRSLREWGQQDPRPDWRACIELYRQAGEGLAAAHARGLVHRDFKPGNAIVDEHGRVRVLDFGLAREFDEEDSASSTADVAPSSDPGPEDAALAARLTRTGAVLGTPAYMPPEQMMGAVADARSDQFSLCVSLFEAVYGERPHEGRSIAALLISMREGSVRPAPRGTTAPPRLREILVRGLSIEPEQRWPSIEALLEQLDGLVTRRTRGRGWRTASIMTLGSGAVMAGVIASGPANDARCSGARAQLDGIWDEARRSEIEAAFAATELSFAPDTWTRVETRLDDYARTWADAHTEACAATSIRQEQTAEVMGLRMACLGGHRASLRTTVDGLTRADERTVEEAVERVDALPDLARCDDTAELDRRHQRMPPPDDPRDARRVEQLRDRLREIQAIQHAGSEPTALGDIEGVVEQAEALGYGPLVAEAWFRKGSLLESSARFSEAERALERALELAAEHAHDELAVETVAELIFVVGTRQARYDAGLTWGVMGRARSEAPGISPGIQATVWHQLGTLLAEQSRLDEALVHFRRALTIQQGRHEPRPLQVALELNAIGVVLQDQGTLDEALAYMRQALAIEEEALGGRHPDVASSLDNIGTVRMGKGQLEQALEHHLRALEIFERAYGETHPAVASALNNIGTVQLDRGELAEARRHQGRALAIRREVFGPRHPSVAASLGNLGNVLVAQGELDEARTRHRESLSIFVEALGPSHPFVAYAEAGLAHVALAMEEFDEAREHARRAISIHEAGQQDPSVLAEARFLLARSLWSTPAERPAARALAERALEHLAAADGSGESLVDPAQIEQWLVEHTVP